MARLVGLHAQLAQSDAPDDLVISHHVAGAVLWDRLVVIQSVGEEAILQQRRGPVR